MTKKQLQKRIFKVLSVIFEVDQKKINIKSSQDNIKQWDSLKHINLIFALEEEFNIKFDTEEVIDLINFKLIENIVSNKIK